MSQKLLLQFLKYVLLDSGILKKLLLSSTRDFWYIAVIIILVTSAVNLSVQQNLLQKEIDRYHTQDIMQECKNIKDGPVPDVPVPQKPPTPETKPPALPPDRRQQHDIKRLLNEIE